MDNYKIALIGLGYVGLPLARLFSLKYPVVGFDVNQSRIIDLMSGHDATLEVDDDLLKGVLVNQNPVTSNLDKGLFCSANLEDIKACNIYIITVPTPIDRNNRPDLTPLLKASELVGGVISKGDIIIYESTVYPGVTEEECVPALEKSSGLKFNIDFYVGYSPERINPGDKEHTVEKIKKVTAGSTPEIGVVVDKLYNSVLLNGTHLAPTIRVAEASKIVENCQRDVNIAFFNELAKMFNVMNINTNDVIAAASSKWNFIKLKPGLVGGHCIGVDPYYLIQKSQVSGFSPDILIKAREVNNSMGEYVANQVIKEMNKKGIMVKNSEILILGVTFKENCPDIRNTKVVDIHRALSEYTNNITVYDPWANGPEIKREFGITIKNQLADLKSNQYQAIILAVAHDVFHEIDILSLKRENGLVYDIKGFFSAGVADAEL
jgi:UDP-N-acetyl-D-galactosamine dehydrogenase